MLLPGEKTSTRIEPARSIYADVPRDRPTLPGVVDAAIWVGYAWADEPRCRAAVVVTGDDEARVVPRPSSSPAQYWDARDDFAFVAPAAPYEACVAPRAGERRSGRTSSATSGDNPTAGGAGDVTWTLARLLERPEFQRADGPTVIYASLPGPERSRRRSRPASAARSTVTAGAAVDDGLHRRCASKGP